MLQDTFPSFNFQSYEQNETALKFLSAGGYCIYILVPLLLISLIWVLIAYFFSDKMMTFLADSKPYPNTPENKKVYQAVENIAITAGLPVPKLYIIDDDSLNAFAAGFSPQSASVFLTKGIIEKLKPLELEAVIAHEMSHIGNQDIRLTGLIIMGLGIFSVLLQTFRLSLRESYAHRSGSRKSSKSNKNGASVIPLVLCVYLAIWVFAYAVAPLIRLAISRQREYLADSSAALLTRNPAALASALKKISSDARIEMLDKYPMMGIACIETPYDKKKKTGLSTLYATHPPIGLRIKRLYEMSGRPVEDWTFI